MVSIISGIGSTLRSAAKLGIKGGMAATDAVRGLAADTGNEFKTLVTEARTELTQSRLSKTTTLPAQPAESQGLCHGIVSTGQSIWAATTGAAASVVTMANEGIATVVAWFYGESKEKAEQQVEKKEERVRHFAREVGRDLASDECVKVIETVILLAV
jgi:hypothetical protein